MSMVSKQAHFLRMISRLILRAEEMGYEVTPGCFRCQKPGHHMKGSLHYKGLAADLNLFLDGKYLSKTEDHEPLGLIWESWGGSWGGRFGDGNHYSLEHEGRK